MKKITIATRSFERRTVMTKFFMKTNLFLSLVFLGVAFLASCATAQESKKPKGGAQSYARWGDKFYQYLYYLDFREASCFYYLLF